MENNTELTTEYLLTYLKENILIITLAFYGFGLTYLFTYYNLKWEIDVTNYISLTGTLFISIKFFFFIVLVTSLFVFLDKLILKIHLRRKSKRSDEEKTNLLMGAIIFSMTVVTIENIFNEEPFYISEYLSIVFYAVLFLAANYFKSKLFFRRIIIVAIIGGIILSLLKANFDYYNKFNFPIQKQIISFTYGNKKYQQSENLIFIGQTESFIFMFERNHQKKYIFSVNEISNYTIERK